jgi:hypothetical protein
MPTPAKKQNYLNNKDLLREIHRSKMSFCYIESPEYRQYDLILNDVSEIDSDAITSAQEARAQKIQSEGYAKAMENHDLDDYRNKPKQKDFAVDLDEIPVDSLVFRVMTYEHIPDEPGRKKNPKTIAKHYAYQNGVLKEVARSHWKGDLETGSFSVSHGRITPTLAKMFIKLVERYSHRANWRSYTYLDEMKGLALVQLSEMSLKFNEQMSDNPFGYYTQAVNNSFTQILNLEKRQQSIRDNILVDQGHMPSYTRQLEHEEEIRQMRENAENENADY